MTPRERMINALERGDPEGLVPHFELEFPSKSCFIMLLNEERLIMRKWVHSFVGAGISICAAGLLGCTHLVSQDTDTAVGIDIGLPADFVPQDEDFAGGAKHGGFMGIRLFRARPLKERGGVHSICVVKTMEGRFPGEPIAVGDIILAANGEPLGPDPLRGFKRAVDTALRRDELLTVTRWRKGGTENVQLDLQVRPPDLTAGGVTNDLHDWQLGPTGMNGWVFSHSQREGASRDARQILVTYIEPGSPSEGKLQLKDVITGVDGKTFTVDARKAFAKAIHEAERESNKGVLNLLVWRSGKKMDIPITLKTFPVKSATSPYNCAKTDAIIDAACDFLKQNKLEANWIGYINGLGMLASGREDLLPKLKEFVHEICVPGEVLSIQKHTSMLCWAWSYKLLFLAEYYLKTNDEYVLPTIEEHATKLAMGQSGVGTWGHSVAAFENEGRYHGRLGGYGAINQQGLTVMLGLPLAQKCGIDNEEISNAIKKGDIFFSYYIDKGTIPYGDHSPNTQWFDDNGKSGSAAVMYDLLDKPEAARFFSGMVLGSSPSGREAGHTGCFWSHLWGGVGAARAGEAASQAFAREMDWAYTLERGIKGNFVFQGNAGEAGKSGESKDKAWDCTGARLLQLCLPRKQIYLTGREMKVPDPLDAKRIGNILTYGEIYTDKQARKSLTKVDILQLLRDELPAVRMTGAKALGEQELNIVDELIEMLDSDSRYARYGACYALSENGYGSDKAVKRLIDLIEGADDLDLRLNAVDALTSRDVDRSLAPAAKEAIPSLLRLCVKRFDMDPRRLLQRSLAFALFEHTGLVTMHGVNGLDSEILVPAIRELLTVDDGRARGAVASVYPTLKEDDLKALWKDIYVATRDIAPSGIMFADQPRASGLKLMQAKGVKEGVNLAIGFMLEDRWGQGGRENVALEVLRGYGPAAQKALPHLKMMKERPKITAEDIAKIDAAIDVIENGKPRELHSIEKYIK